MSCPPYATISQAARRHAKRARQGHISQGSWGQGRSYCQGVGPNGARASPSSSYTVNGRSLEELQPSAQVGLGPSKPTNGLVLRLQRLGVEAPRTEEDRSNLQVCLRWPSGVQSRLQRASFPRRHPVSLIQSNASWLKRVALPWAA